MAVRTSMPVRVWRTRQGKVYHRKPTCEALLDGQRMAGSFGKGKSEPEQIPLSVAMSDGLAECYHCFPENVPPDAKPCKVLIDGGWVDGFLLKWVRSANGHWTGLVNHRWESGRRVVYVDASRLRPG